MYRNEHMLHILLHIIGIFGFALSIYAADEIKTMPLANTDGSISSIVNGCVNVILKISSSILIHHAAMILPISLLVRH
jgi:hypothetical protein